jgi:hypothetical protein
MKLAALQQAMQRDLALGADAGFAALVGDHPGVRVYRNNYCGQLHECLRDTYEQCWAWLGDECFAAVADGYIDSHPPTGWTLDAYGHAFDAFLAVRFPGDPELCELAWLEWSLRRAFDGADSTPVDPATLGRIDWDKAVFGFAPTLRLGTMTTNAAAIWTALSEERHPGAVAILPVPATVLVWRQDLAPHFRTLDPGEARVLHLARAGQAFGTICATLAQDMAQDEAAALAGACLGQWLRDGLIIGIG